MYFDVTVTIRCDGMRSICVHVLKKRLDSGQLDSPGVWALRTRMTVSTRSHPSYGPYLRMDLIVVWTLSSYGPYLRMDLIVVCAVAAYL
jgi:hypothetical protein